MVAEFCERTLNTCMGDSSGSVTVSSVQAGQTTILHVLGFMKDSIRFFPKARLKVRCSLFLNNSFMLHLSNKCFNFLYSLLKVLIQKIPIINLHIVKIAVD